MNKMETSNCRKHVLIELKSAFSLINRNYKYIKSVDNEGEEILGAGEWLLDNIYLIEKEYRSIRENMPREYFDNLHKESKESEIPKILEYAKEYIHIKDGEITKEEVVDFLKCKNSMFTMAELWAFPLMLKIAIILNISGITNKLSTFQKERVKGKYVAYKIVDKKEEAKKILGNLTEEEKTSSIFWDTLKKILRDNSIEDNEIWEYILNESPHDYVKNNFIEGSLEQDISSYISSLRRIEDIEWREVFNETSYVEKQLLKDPSHTYELMDFETKDNYRHKIEKLARKFNIEENILVDKLLELSNKALIDQEDEYKTHVGYYLIDEGIYELKKTLDSKAKVRFTMSEVKFVVINILITLGITATVLILNYGFGTDFTATEFIISALIILIPASEIAVALINWSVSKIVPIRLMPKINFLRGIPDSFKTVIVVPAMLTSPKRTRELISKLEVVYHANKDKNIYFAILGDFADYDKEVAPGDKSIIELGLKEIRKLNYRYFKNEEHFFLLNRKRTFNKSEGVFMGHERKRGKLIEFMALLRNDKNHTYETISGDISKLREVKFLITLDSDTFMPKDSAKELVGTMAHVLNRAKLEKNKVKHGYGIIQPKISISLESKNKSLFSRIFAGDSGVDGYSVAYSDTYEDLFAEGSFVGKGIIDIDVFWGILKDEIPENKVLSHDLLEGAYARCGLVNDIEFIDNYPASYGASIKRLHRWVRGDWQLFRWLFSEKISLLSKWKIFDNLRRSLLAQDLLLAVLLNLTVLEGEEQIVMLCFLGAITPLIFTVTDFVVTPKNTIIGTFKNLRQCILIISFIPYQAYIMTDAIVRSIYRMLVSKKNLLQWQTAEDVERTIDNSLVSYIKKMWFSICAGMLVILISAFSRTSIMLINIPIGFVWVISPILAYHISQVDKRKVYTPLGEDREFVRDNARRIWAYYEDFVNEENNFLAPDNYQENPYKGVAYRTSPTNIGMGLISNVVAYDLGYIPLCEVVDRLELILEGMEKLERYKGHYLNWYDTRSLEGLWPRYISTVDSGNLLGYLMVIKKSLEEYKDNPIIRSDEIEGIKDTLKILGIDCDDLDIDIKNYKTEFERILNILDEEIAIKEDRERAYWLEKAKKEVKLKLAYYDYIFDGINKLFTKKFREKAPSTYELIKYIQELSDISSKEFKVVLKEKLALLRTLINRIDSVISKITKIIEKMDFKFLYNPGRGLFYIGFNIEENSSGSSYYDLLASESRATSFITIALNEVPKEHWFKLSRAMTNAFNEKALISWSGTMFEYFMPSLIMKSYKDTLLNMTYFSVIAAQQNFARRRKVPWGISESAYYQFDMGDNYQYKAFGVPGIGLKRGLEDELVVSPYSTLITLPYSQEEGIENLKKLKSKKLYGRYGFIESIDYTKNRVSKMDVAEEEGESKKVSCYMVHHLGMSLMALDNVLNNNILQERFHSIPEIKSVELLLKEKIPNRITFDREDVIENRTRSIEVEDTIPRIYEGAIRANPEVLLLSNGSYSIMTTLTGSGYAKKDNMTIYRWKGDSTTDSTGNFIYIKNLNSNDYWSATYEPCKKQGDEYEAKFKIDKGVYKRRDGDIESELEIVVSPEDDVEIRKLKLKNIGSAECNVEVTSYIEITLQTFEGDAVHPSFSNLFISTEYLDDKKCILGNRRPRSSGSTTPYIVHKLVTNENLEEDITYETSRINFIGRNRSLGSPKSLDKEIKLSNTVGTVLDPIMSIRGVLRLSPGEEKIVYYITSTTNSKDEILEIVDKYSEVNKLERCFYSYSKAVLLELRALGIKSEQANIYQRLASYILFLHSGRSDRESYIAGIKHNQQDLWAYGISGDLPIAMALVKTEEDMDLVRGMIKMHYYWKSKGLKVDLLIYNDEESSYELPLQQNIISAVNLSKEGEILNKPGGIFIHNQSTMNKDIRDFLIGISSLYVDSDKGSIITQIKDIDKLQEEVDLRHKELSNIHKLNYEIDREIVEIDKENLLDITKKGVTNKYKLNEFDVGKLDFWNGYGGFDKEDKSYVIKLSDFKNTPAPWINVISNDDFGFHISETGSSYTWCGNSRENKITPWSNDWVTDPLGEALYIRDEDNGSYFSITPKPVRDGGDYIIKHSFGYSTFIHEAYGIRGEEQVFCPKGEKVKLQKVVLENLTDEDKSLSIYYYAQLVLGVFSYGSAKYISTAVRNDYIVGENPYSKYFGKGKAYLTIVGGEALNFTGDRKEFIGIGGKLSEPEALKYKTLSNKTGSIYDPCLVAKSTFSLRAKEKKEIVVILGQEESYEAIENKINKYKIVEKCNNALEEVKEYWSYFLGNIQVKTNDKAMDYLLNGWLLYQTYSCRYLSRTAFYQSGGAYGYRDQLQDSIALGVVDSEITKTQILRSAEKQYLEGDVQHWWHPVINSGIKTRFSDDLLWLPYVTSEYISKTGDYSILNLKARYLEDEPLKEGEDERYTIVDKSNTEGSIYEHCIRAIDRALKFGKHNIPLMGSGDWNDGMSTVGNKGKGESVWLGWFLYKILDDFNIICSYMQDSKRQEYFNEQKIFIKENLEKEAWDGEWYRRAYFDNGIPLGSSENEECKIDSLAQSWSLISGAAKKDRSIKAMEAVDKKLVKEEEGIILLLTPPFEKSDLEPGYIKGYVAGVRENGGQYTHAAVWVILALTKLGFGDKAMKYYSMINPINHTNSESKCDKYKLEPYVMAADVYIREPHVGRGGWSWYTGAAGWMYKVGIEDILGLKTVEGKWYKIEPCIPKEWESYEIKIKNNKEDYKIVIERGEYKGIVINNEKIEGNLICKNKGKLDVKVII